MITVFMLNSLFTYRTKNSNKIQASEHDGDLKVNAAGIQIIMLFATNFLIGFIFVKREEKVD